MPDVTPAEIHDLTRRALMAQGASAAVADRAGAGKGALR